MNCYGIGHRNPFVIGRMPADAMVSYGLCKEQTDRIQAAFLQSPPGFYIAGNFVPCYMKRLRGMRTRAPGA